MDKMKKKKDLPHCAGHEIVKMYLGLNFKWQCEQETICH